MKAVGGRLKFKGESKKRKQRDKGNYCNETAETVTEEMHDVKILIGNGRITSSGTTIHGHETAFMDQLSVGDAVIISHPVSLVDETKVVRMVLSNSSISVSSAFSSDLISTATFRYVKAPKASHDDLAREMARKRERTNTDEKAAVGTYASDGGSLFTYRVKKEGAAGGYKIITESTGGNVTRGDLLDMRSLKKSDRYCY